MLVPSGAHSTTVEMIVTVARGLHHQFGLSQHARQRGVVRHHFGVSGPVLLPVGMIQFDRTPEAVRDGEPAGHVAPPV
jgi:hypothetical protein